METKKSENEKEIQNLVKEGFQIKSIYIERDFSKSSIETVEGKNIHKEDEVKTKISYTLEKLKEAESENQKE